jgi:hypothetical protein
MLLLRRFYLAFVLGRGIVSPRGFFFNLEGIGKEEIDQWVF